MTSSWNVVDIIDKRKGSSEEQRFVILCTLLLSLSIRNAYGWSLAGLSNWLGKDDTSLEEQQAQLDLAARPRVLNFFPVPVEEECLSQDKRRLGICMNTYECRIQHGKSHGPCALGFGVCCIFTVSCDQEVQNNLTYVTSPGFPNLIDRPMNCSVIVRKIDRQVSQLRIDFVHFNIGQPNRRTGVCDEDVMEIRNGKSNLQLCGWNSGQHVYVDVNEGEGETVILNFKLPNELQSRMWEMRITQLGFEDRAPAGCLQYFHARNGTLRTWNYLPNGRFLANQDYLLCIRQERDMCGISYSPCTRDSFRIGPPRVPTTAANVSASSVNASSSADNTNLTESQQTDTMVEGSGSETFDQQVLSSSDLVTTLTRRCRDRVLIPCDFEEFITPGNDGVGVCNLEHCGNSLCNGNEMDNNGNCRVETWATPFRIRVAFGPGEDTGSALEDNIGMCLLYEQLPCVS